MAWMMGSLYNFGWNLNIRIWWVWWVPSGSQTWQWTFPHLDLFSSMIFPFWPPYAGDFPCLITRSLSPDPGFILLMVTYGYRNNNRCWRVAKLWAMGNYIWLVVDLPLWKIWKSVGMMKFPIHGKIRNIPNHQPEGNHQHVWWSLEHPLIIKSGNGISENPL